MSSEWWKLLEWELLSGRLRGQNTSRETATLVGG